MEELLSKMINGDKEAYDELINELYKYLYTIAKDKLEDDDDVRDAVQETIIKFTTNYKKIKNPKAIKKWVRTVLINTCNDIYKSNKKMSNLVDKLKENVDLTESEIDTIDIKDNSLLECLNEKEKTIVFLRYLEGYSISQICKELGENENTVKSNIYRAKQKLFEKVDKKRQLSRLSIMLIIIVIATSGVTFGGKIINTLKEKITMFQITASKGIDDAISSEHVENVNTELVYNNEVGISITDVAMDNKLLYIAYMLDLGNNTNIKDIELEKYSIIDDKGNVLAVEIDTDVKNRFGSDYASGGVTYATVPEQIENGLWKYATTFQVIYDKDYPLSEALNVEISKFSILTDEGRKYFDGDWKFEISLDNSLNRNYDSYTYMTNDKIKNISAKLYDLSFELTIEFNENINKNVATSNNMILQDENGEFINYYSKVVNVYKNKITYICDIGKYSKNIDKLNMYIKYDYGAEKFVDVVLER